jgi:putative pyruvate formate lyase activating enzyme
MKSLKTHRKLCVNCPHLCGSKREEEDYGFCNTGRGYNISSICIHRGEEPVISGPKGICNIFFSHCNLQCIYCQNHQISRNDVEETLIPLDEVVRNVSEILDTGIKSVGFVSPSHMVDQVKEIIDAINQAKQRPVYVWNSNGYDWVKTLKSLEGLVDVYLPDFKYSDKQLGKTLSGVENYPQIALKAINEMIRQRGTSISLNDEGVIESGVIIRHLILPGHVENSKACLRMIADELSTSVHISLMSQYHPVEGLSKQSELNRTITREEYEEVIEEFERLGFYRGWTQELESESYYNPDFVRDHPFEIEDKLQEKS